MESGIDIQHMLFPLSGEERRRASNQENAKHKNKIEFYKRELQWGARHLIGKRFPLFVLDTRGMVWKWLKRAFNLWSEAVCRRDDATYFPIFVLAAVNSDNHKFHLF